MKRSLFLATALLLLSQAANAGSGTPFVLEGRCTGAGASYVKNGRNGLDIKPSLNAIANAAGKTMHLYSCFRSQAVQDSLLRARHCAPRFGRADCTQSTANHSAHTYTIAADMHSLSSNLHTQCQMIAQGRAVAGAGLGGVGTYPGGDGHFDMGARRAWNRCRGVIGGNTPSFHSAAVEKYKAQRASGAGPACYPEKNFPSCCGPVRQSQGLCQM